MNNIISEDFNGTTIEERLYSYTKKENNERSNTLWHAWKNNQKLLSQLLELTLPSFPTYSNHNESHAKKVLHNIERILGKQGISRLSPTNCFMLLNAAYLHDIGMCITYADRKAMVNSTDFVRLLDRICDNNMDMKKAVENMKQSIYPSHEDKDGKDRNNALKEKYSQKLDVYTAVINLMAEFQRSIHGQESGKRINSWVSSENNELGIGLRLSGIPLRIFLRIADCARLHTDWDFNNILELPEYDDGYDSNDLMHPRFVAVMLQLGDALDLDNDRFHPFTIPFVGNLSSTSQTHFQKHQSIRRLTITPKDIYIEADCENQKVYRLLRKECDALESILQKASYYWSSIAPADLQTFLPTLHPPKIVLKGKEIPRELISAKFNISQSRAFRLIEGANIYDKKFAFLRELVQNALDATKIQAWSDLCYSSKHSEFRRENDPYNLCNILRHININDYPITVRLNIGIRDFSKDDEEIISINEIDDIESYQDQNKAFSYGVIVEVQDYGTGISKKDVLNISSVGSSYEKRMDDINEMPDTLKPTGEFGIGLQSCFLVCNQFKAVSHTHFGEAHEISFSSASNLNDGYINISPKDETEIIPYGTTFKLFIDCEHKLPHSECIKAWDIDSSENDIFSPYYEAFKIKREAKELIAQLTFYLDELLGETIFPIYVELNSNDLDGGFCDFIKRNVKTLGVIFTNSEYKKSPKKSWIEIESCTDYKNKTINVEPKDFIEILNLTKEKSVSHQSFVDSPSYTHETSSHNNYNGTDFIFVETDLGKCALNMKTMKLYVWSFNCNTFAVLGAKRFIESTLKKCENNANTKLYIKGIHTANMDIDFVSGLLEVLDIHKGLKKSCINLSRGGFTDKGIQELKNKIYPEIINTAIDGLRKMNLNGSENFKLLIAYEKEHKLENYYDRERILSALFLIYLHKQYSLTNNIISKNSNGTDNCMFELLLKHIQEKLQQDNFGLHSELGIIFSEADIEKILYAVKKSDNQTNTFADIFSEQKSIAILCLKDEIANQWINIPTFFSEDVNSILCSLKHNDSNFFYNQEKLVDWGDVFIEQINRNHADIVNHYRRKRTALNQLLYIWMLQNMHIEAQFASFDGKSVLSVLSFSEVNFSVLNKNAKYLQIKKISENETTYPRYCVRTWSNYYFLGIKNTFENASKVFNNVFSIAIGPKTKNDNSKLIIPFSGVAIKKMDEARKKYEAEELHNFEYEKKLFDLIKKSQRSISSYYDEVINAPFDEARLNSTFEMFEVNNLDSFKTKAGVFSKRFEEILKDLCSDKKTEIKKLDKDYEQLIPNSQDILNDLKNNTTNNISKIADAIKYLCSIDRKEIEKDAMRSVLKLTNTNISEKEYLESIVEFYANNTKHIKEFVANSILEFQSEIYSLICQINFDTIENIQNELKQYMP